jgi:hypothetical protein
VTSSDINPIKHFSCIAMAQCMYREVNTMAMTYKTSPVTRWLRPGQRFAQVDGPLPGEGELTVARIVQDRMGLTHAILRDSAGREVSTYVDQIQFAIEAGMLSPVETTEAGLAC